MGIINDAKNVEKQKHDAVYVTCRYVNHKGRGWQPQLHIIVVTKGYPNTHTEDVTTHGNAKKRKRKR
jgi:hypothetical protein